MNYLEKLQPFLMADTDTDTSGADTGADNATGEATGEQKADTAFDINSLKENKDFNDYVSKIADKSARTARDNASKEFQKQLEQEKARWQEESKMTAEQKAKKQQEEYEAKLAERERELNKKDLRLKSIDYLESKGLSKNLADIVVSGNDSEEVMQEKVDNIAEVISKEAERLKAEALAGSVKAPKAGDTPNPMSKQDRLLEIAKANANMANKFTITQK